MFVPKRPKPYDFCGQPPCGICFDWVEPQPPKKVERSDPIETKIEEPKPVDGVVKMATDLLGRRPSTEELAAVKRGAELVHEKNLLRLKESQDVEQQFKTADEERRITMVCEAIITTKVKERNAPKPKKELNTVNLDDMDRTKLKEAANMTAPVDEELLRRERQKKTAAQIQKEQMEVYYNSTGRR